MHLYGTKLINVVLPSITIKELPNICMCLHTLFA